MAEWTYKVVSADTEYELKGADLLLDRHPGTEAMQKWLNSEGAEGWELVAFVPAKEVRVTVAQEHFAVFKKLASSVDVQRKADIESERARKQSERAKSAKGR